MRICWVSQALPYLPSRGGFRLYGGNLIPRLAQRHTVDLISLLVDDDQEYLAWPKQYCAHVTTIPVRAHAWPSRVQNFVAGYVSGKPTHFREQLNELLRAGIQEGKWDVIHVEGAFMGATIDPDLPIAKVLSVHDSWTLRCAEMRQCSQNFAERLQYAVLSAYEPRFERLVYPRFERCTVVADRDEAELRRVVPRARVALIPYGTDTDYFHNVGVAKRPSELVFHSHLAYAPNVEAATEFATEIYPLVQRQVPDAVFHLVGAAPVQKIQSLATRPGIRLSANVADVRPEVCSGQVYVCAIRHGTGLKSKVLEAMAMGMPIVCYPGSTVGIDGRWGEHFLVAETAQQFASYVVELLRNPERRQQLARAGRQLVERSYSWESRVRDYEQLYADVIEERHGKKSRGAAAADSERRLISTHN